MHYLLQASPSMPAEHRRYPRKRTTDFVQVVNTMTDEIVGRLGDLSASGMMLLAEKELVDDGLFQFRFNLPAAGGRSRVIEVGAHELWSATVGNGEQFLCGFRFIDISPEDETAVATWVETPDPD